jgi:ATP-binding cassette, subfamily A (ABC1), member 3
LKSSLGEGYTVSVTFPLEQQTATTTAQGILALIIPISEHARCTELSETTATFALKAKDARVVRQVLDALEAQKASGSITGYEVHGTTLEDIFIGLMGRDSQFAEGAVIEEKPSDGKEPNGASTPSIPKDPTPLALSDGRQTWFFQQAWTIYRKRLLILRRAWLGPILAMAVACAGACIPLFFMKDRVKSCVPDFRPAFAQSLLLPWSSAANLSLTDILRGLSPAENTAIVAPPNALQPLSTFFTNVTVNTVANRQALLDDIQANARNLSFGGIFMNTPGNDSLLTFEASTITNGPTMLNLVSNVWLATAAGENGTAGPVIAANYMPFNARARDQLTPMKWVC